MDIQEIVRVVRSRATALVGFDWQPFGVKAVLRFRDRTGGSFIVYLEGLHALITRQSLFGTFTRKPPSEEHWEDWVVHYFDIQTSGEFLARVLNRSNGLQSQVDIYSKNGASQEMAEFVRPVHVALVTSGGHLDAVCESVRLRE